MMHNKSIYKKLCTATISLGLLFSIGQFAYAHDPNLKVVETFVGSNPTIENLTLLRTLYKMDIQQHHINGENDEANEAEQKLKKTQIQIISILSSEKAKAQEIYNKALNTQYIKDCKCAVDCFDNLLKMLQIAGDNSSLVAECCETFITLSNDNKELPLERVLLNKAMLALRFAQRNQSMRHLGNTFADSYLSYVKCCETFIALASDNKELTLAVMNTKISVARVRLEQAKIMLDNDITPENYETLAQRYDALAELAKSHPQYSENVLEYQMEAANAIAMQLDIIDWHNTTAEQYEALAQRWDAVVELAKSRPAYSDRLLGYQIQAAKARLEQQARIISQNGITPENYETLAQRYDELSQSYNLDGQYANAIEYKWSAIRTRLSMVNLTEDFDEKCNAYERAIEYNDDAATFAEESGWPHDSVAEFKEKAAKSRIKLAETILEHESTLDNYNNWVSRCEELVQLFDENDHDSIRVAAIARVNAAIARAKRAKFIAEQHETIENYDMLMQCWNEVVELSEIVNEHTPEAFRQYEVIEEARHEAELAMDKRDFAAMIRQSTFLSIAALLGRR